MSSIYHANHHKRGLRCNMETGKAMEDIQAGTFDESTSDLEQIVSGSKVTSDRTVLHSPASPISVSDTGNTPDNAPSKLSCTLPVSVSTPAWKSWKQKGNDSFGASKFTEAVECYGKALTEQPPMEETLSILSNRALALLRLRQFEAAFEDCAQALSLKPDFGKALWRRSQASASLGRWADAIKDLDSLLAMENSLLAQELGDGSRVELESEHRFLQQLQHESRLDASKLGGSQMDILVVPLRDAIQDMLAGVSREPTGKLEQLTESSTLEAKLQRLSEVLNVCDEDAAILFRNANGFSLLAELVGQNCLRASILEIFVRMSRESSATMAFALGNHLLAFWSCLSVADQPSIQTATILLVDSMRYTWFQDRILKERKGLKPLDTGILEGFIRESRWHCNIVAVLEQIVIEGADNNSRKELQRLLGLGMDRLLHLLGDPQTLSPLSDTSVIRYREFLLKLTLAHGRTAPFQQHGAKILERELESFAKDKRLPESIIPLVHNTFVVSQISRRTLEVLRSADIVSILIKDLLPEPPVEEDCISRAMDVLAKIAKTSPIFAYNEIVKSLGVSSVRVTSFLQSLVARIETASALTLIHQMILVVSDKVIDESGSEVPMNSTLGRELVSRVMEEERLSKSLCDQLSWYRTHMPIGNLNDGHVKYLANCALVLGDAILLCKMIHDCTFLRRCVRS